MRDNRLLLPRIVYMWFVIMWVANPHRPIRLPHPGLFAAYILSFIRTLLFFSCSVLHPGVTPDTSPIHGHHPVERSQPLPRTVSRAATGELLQGATLETRSPTQHFRPLLASRFPAPPGIMPNPLIAICGQQFHGRFDFSFPVIAPGGRFRESPSRFTVWVGSQTPYGGSRYIPKRVFIQAGTCFLRVQRQRLLPEWYLPFPLSRGRRWRYSYATPGGFTGYEMLYRELNPEASLRPSSCYSGERGAVAPRVRVTWRPSRRRLSPPRIPHPPSAREVRLPARPRWSRGSR